ncbi:MAG TPA: hypothetical protein VFB79_09035 [Candidatus Angelobacter sp.]|nr:hypothetical protein [Candidatus Angelobacter sp.]
MCLQRAAVLPAFFSISSALLGGGSKLRGLLFTGNIGQSHNSVVELRHGLLLALN